MASLLFGAPCPLQDTGAAGDAAPTSHGAVSLDGAVGPESGLHKHTGFPQTSVSKLI